MSDTAVDPEVEKIVKITKRGFDPRERLKGRALRKDTIVLFLDEETGEELGDAYDVFGAIGQKVGRQRSGVLGDLDQLEETTAEATKGYEEALAAEKITAAEKKKLTEAYESLVAAFEERKVGLEARRDELVAKLHESGITIKVRAVPPVIQKDMLRRARETCGITEKGIPADKQDEVNESQLLHLMTVMFQEVKDNATGEINGETTYDDAVAYKEMLPDSQFDRLDQLIGKLQFTDAISRSIESQEDFS